MGSTGLSFPLVNIAMGGAVVGREGGVSIWVGQQVVCVEQQSNFMLGMDFKEWDIRTDVTCFDDQLCCIFFFF